MDPILAWMKAREDDITGLIRRMVECESPSDDPAAVNRFVELLADELLPMGKVKRVRAKGFGDHLLAEFALPGKKKSGQILALGHSDTVWPVGTLATMPFRVADGRLWGPGVLDMKSGVAFFVYAMKALREMAIPVGRKVLLQLNSDEEVGSPTSRPLTGKNAAASLAVLVVEPGTGLEGKAKTARKGVGLYRVRVTGKAAHAGVDFAAGASAIVELARQIAAMDSFNGLRPGLTVNVGVVRGGTRSNVVAAEAEAEVDFRVTRAKDAAALASKFSRLRVVDPRCSLTVEGGMNRPPLERTPGVVALFKKARALARELEITLEESATGGGSDGNFTAGMGIPTLDGIGAVGEGAHAAHESILADRIADRAALLAKLVTAI